MQMYNFSIPPLVKSLTNLAAILKKGEAYADEKSIEHAVLLNARLFPDMYALTRQVQIATDMAKGAAARLAGLEVPKYDDDETSFAQLQARIAKTLAFINSVSPEQLTGSETKQVSVMVRKAELKFSGEHYLLKWVLPNVHFHVATTYNILRHNGVALGKSDFLGATQSA